MQVLFKEASYSGGGNISFKGTLEDRSYSMTILFQGELPVKDLPIHLIYSNPDRALKLRKLQKLIFNSLKESGVADIEAKFKELLMDKTLFYIEGNYDPLFARLRKVRFANNNIWILDDLHLVFEDLVPQTSLMDFNGFEFEVCNLV
ncbi:hypothetical protein GIB67_034850 [Kingdonia uniflora]|uniref:Cell growth-regulating nucleolar protein-like winged helix domain-containing protein n=1 Tax=Kingdonia uniflora TaxID=39325 RepID=A0A7J7MEF9_9MAGN|nr:hypothetical protein GIB67_034850 [Kingdonia uniflora]